MLLIIGCLNFLGGLFYVVEPGRVVSFPYLLEILENNWPVFGVRFWGFAWVLVGLVAVVYAYRFKDSLATGLVAFSYAGWSLSYLGGWLYSVVFKDTVAQDFRGFMLYGTLVGFLLFWHGDRKGVR